MNVFLFYLVCFYYIQVCFLDVKQLKVIQIFLSCLYDVELIDI